MAGLSQIIYPQNCTICQKAIFPSKINEHSVQMSDFPSKGFVCPDCAKSITINHHPYCPHCFRHRTASELSIYCKTCTSLPDDLSFIWSCCPYTNPLKIVIHRFKYQQKTYYQYLFHHLIVSFLLHHQLDILQFDLIIPIPLHLSRLRERGFNQSELIAKGISQYFQLPLNTQSLKRHHPTKTQSLLGKKERWTNMDSAFRIKSPLKVKGKNILLIDDLMTTGATATFAARALKSFGAEKVCLLTLAIA